MTLHVCILGIDGSGKSTITAALPAVLAAELGVCAGSAGEYFHVSGPEEDHLAPNFHPNGISLSATFSKRIKRTAKKVADNKRLYPALKLAQLLSKDHAAFRLGKRHKADVIVSDGNALLSATGRAANYLRPASEHVEGATAGPGPKDLSAVYDYILDGKPISEESQPKLPNLKNARRLCRLLRLFSLHGVWLPDVVIFLDLSPSIAIERITRRGVKVDGHENKSDLAQAREMYLRTLDAYSRSRGVDAVHHINIDHLAPGAVLAAVIKALRPHLHAATERSRTDTPLGTTETELGESSIWKKVFNYRYLVRYVLDKWFQGAWREPLFPFSKLGRLFLREGYSANVMRAIYDREEKEHGLFDRMFLEYPLHRAVYDRLQILTRAIQPALEERLRAGGKVTLFTAPSGFAYDILQPLEAIVKRDPAAASRVRVVAADLDPHDILKEELADRAARIGIDFEFLRGSINSSDMRVRFAASAPYDMVLFVGLSSWLPKPQFLDHMRWVRNHIRDDGLLITDSFTPEAYALSGRYVGFKANYYNPDIYKTFLDYCGFDGLAGTCESGRDEINHVMTFAPRRQKRIPSRRQNVMAGHT